MKKFKELKLMTEEKKDKYDEGEYDQEGDMAKSDLRSIMANSKKLHDMIEDADNLPEWCQNKITLAEDYISTVANYMTAEMNEGAIPAKEKTVTVKHKTSGKELVVTAQKAKELKKQDYHPVKEEVEQIDEAINHGDYTITHKPYNGTDKQRHVSSNITHAYSTNQKKLGIKHSEDEDEIGPDRHITVKNNKTGEVSHHVATHNNTYKDEHQKQKISIRAHDKITPHDDKHAKVIKSFLAPTKNSGQLTKEEVEQIDEKNVPTSPEKWAQAKSQAKAKFDVYPSAYANGWAAKKYKAMGGGWKSVSEAKEEPPFDKPYTTVKKVVTDKSGAKHSPMSRARDIARAAMKKQMEKMKPVKESLEESRKAEIVKEIMKKKKDKSEDAFQKDPELTTTLTKVI
jgi:hypothetical protein